MNETILALLLPSHFWWIWNLYCSNKSLFFGFYCYLVMCIVFFILLLVCVSQYHAGVGSLPFAQRDRLHMQSAEWRHPDSLRPTECHRSQPLPLLCAGQFSHPRHAGATSRQRAESVACHVFWQYGGWAIILVLLGSLFNSLAAIDVTYVFQRGLLGKRSGKACP